MKTWGPDTFDEDEGEWQFGSDMPLRDYPPPPPTSPCVNRPCEPQIENVNGWALEDVTCAGTPTTMARLFMDAFVPGPDNALVDGAVWLWRDVCLDLYPLETKRVTLKWTAKQGSTTDVGIGATRMIAFIGPYIPADRRDFTFLPDDIPPDCQDFSYFEDLDSEKIRNFLCRGAREPGFHGDMVVAIGFAISDTVDPTAPPDTFRKIFHYLKNLQIDVETL